MTGEHICKHCFESISRIEGTVPGVDYVLYQNAIGQAICGESDSPIHEPMAQSVEMLLTINLLRQRLRDRDVKTYREEASFYAEQFDVAADRLMAMAEVELAPVSF